jgi:hypothetical protein
MTELTTEELAILRRLQDRLRAEALGDAAVADNAATSLPRFWNEWGSPGSPNGFRRSSRASATC